jgi:hypothetical protein
MNIYEVGFHRIVLANNKPNLNGANGEKKQIFSCETFDSM